MKWISFCKITILTIGLTMPFLLQSQQLISSESKGAFTKEQLNAQYGPFAQNGIKLYKIRYTMPDLKGVTDTVSGLLLLPDRTNVVFPTVVAMHGTVDSKVDAPSNLRGGYELGGIFAANGYVTLMPDYLGLGDSKSFHPYVHAASEASSGVNMLYAVRQYLSQNNILVNNQLFLTGYSQGGHASMALHQTLEKDYTRDFTVTAAAHLSGPYSISNIMRNTILSDKPYAYPAYHAYTFLSYDLAYNLYNNIESVFKPVYAREIEKFLADSITVSQLNVRLTNELSRNYGSSVTRNMLQDSIINILTNNPDHPIYKALIANDTYNWAAKAPTRLFYCKADDQVPYRNSVIADSVMNKLGATDTKAIDVNSNADHGGCILPALLNTLSFFAQYQRIQTDAKDIALNRLPIEAFPNPTDDFMVFRNAPDGALLQIMDLNGKIQLSTTLAGTREVNLQNLSKGVYFAKITSRQGQWIGKIVLR